MRVTGTFSVLRSSRRGRRQAPSAACSRQRVSAAGLLLALVGGCSSTGGDNVLASAEPAGSGVVCRVETPTGSHYPRRICRTEDQIAKEREAARKAFDRQLPTSINGK